jgi:hypothetical protein
MARIDPNWNLHDIQWRRRPDTNWGLAADIHWQ